VGKGGVEKVLFGGTGIATAIGSGGIAIVSSGGLAAGTTINKGGTEMVSAGGVASDTNVSSGGVLIVSSGGLADPTTIFKGGTLNVLSHGNVSGPFINSGTVNVAGTVTYGTSTFQNAGAVHISSSGDWVIPAGVNMMLSGSGTMSLSFGNIIGGGTLTNVDNIITGVGGGFTTQVVNSAAIEALGTKAVLGFLHSVTNSGELSAIGTSASIYLADRVTNKLFIDALGTSAGIFIANSVTNVGGLLHAFGAGAFIAINSGTVFGGTLETSGSHAAITGRRIHAHRCRYHSRFVRRGRERRDGAIGRHDCHFQHAPGIENADPTPPRRRHHVRRPP
jgi:autotransporter passenger strand-loop-strand repeat protein